MILCILLQNVTSKYFCFLQLVVVYIKRVRTGGGRGPAPRMVAAQTAPLQRRAVRARCERGAGHSLPRHAHSYTEARRSTW